MKKKPVGISPGDWTAVRDEPDQTMGEESMSAPASSFTSSNHTVTVGRTLGRAPPSFGGIAPSAAAPSSGRVPPPSGKAPTFPGRAAPTFGNTPPSLPPTLPQVVTSRKIEEEKKGISPLTFCRPQDKPIAPQATPSTLLHGPTGNNLPIEFFGSIRQEQACDKMEKKSKMAAPMECGPSRDAMMSFMEEEQETFKLREEMRAKRMTYENVKRINLELEDYGRKRQSNITSPMRVSSMESNEFLKVEEDRVADLCEFLLREMNGVEGRFVRSLMEEKDVYALLKLMMDGGLRPVKICDWAEKMDDFNEYYRDGHVREVCEKLPQGIVRVENGSFMMGEALAKYTDLFRDVYTHELMSLIGSDDGVYEKNISTMLGVESLMASLSIDGKQMPFVKLKRNGENFIQLRV